MLRLPSEPGGASAPDSTQWKQAGDRYKVILDEWRTIKGVDRKTDEALWKRFSRARQAFNRRRGSHFADLDRQRLIAKSRKEELVAEAEALAESDEWSATAARYRDLTTSSLSTPSCQPVPSASRSYACITPTRRKPAFS